MTWTSQISLTDCVYFPNNSVKVWEIPHQSGMCLKLNFSDFIKIWSTYTYCEDISKSTKFQASISNSFWDIAVKSLNHNPSLPSSTFRRVDFLPAFYSQISQANEVWSKTSKHIRGSLPRFMHEFRKGGIHLHFLEMKKNLKCHRNFRQVCTWTLFVTSYANLVQISFTKN